MYNTWSLSTGKGLSEVCTEIISTTAKKNPNLDPSRNLVLVEDDTMVYTFPADCRESLTYSGYWFDEIDIDHLDDLYIISFTYPLLPEAKVFVDRELMGRTEVAMHEVLVGQGIDPTGVSLKKYFIDDCICISYGPLPKAIVDKQRYIVLNVLTMYTKALAVLAGRHSGYLSNIRYYATKLAEKPSNTMLQLYVKQGITDYQEMPKNVKKWWEEFTTVEEFLTHFYNAFSWSNFPDILSKIKRGEILIGPVTKDDTYYDEYYDEDDDYYDEDELRVNGIFSYLSWVDSNY